MSRKQLGLGMIATAMLLALFATMGQAQTPPNLVTTEEVSRAQVPGEQRREVEEPEGELRPSGSDSRADLVRITEERDMWKARALAAASRPRAALAEIQNGVAKGTYVTTSDVTVEQACADWLAGRHSIRPTTRAATAPTRSSRMATP